MPRILVVEDDQNSRYLITQILRRSGYDIEEVDNGLSALEYLGRDQHFDLIMSDVRMSKMDGLSLLNELKKKYPTIPVMLLSVHARAEWVGEALRRGASAYLQKPFTKDQLVEAVQSIVPLKQSNASR
jgi:CheY-like chemotaxis protein